MTKENNKNSLQYTEAEDDKKLNLRPNSLKEFIGQNFLKSNLQAYIQSSKKTKNNLDHIILYGPPGLGKPLSLILFLMKKMLTFTQPRVQPFQKKVTLLHF